MKLGVILKKTGEFIGVCGTGIKDELPAPNREIVYAISKDYTNKGYSTEAAKGLMNYLFAKTNVENLHALAHIHNLPSNRVIQKSGFHYINSIEIDNENYHCYKLSKREWEKNKK